MNDQERYHDEMMAEMQSQRLHFEPEPTGRNPEYCRWCHWHHTCHEPHTMECPPAGAPSGFRW